MKKKIFIIITITIAIIYAATLTIFDIKETNKARATYYKNVQYQLKRDRGMATFLVSPSLLYPNTKDYTIWLAALIIYVPICAGIYSLIFTEKKKPITNNP